MLNNVLTLFDIKQKIKMFQEMSIGWTALKPWITGDGNDPSTTLPLLTHLSLFNSHPAANLTKT